MDTDTLLATDIRSASLATLVRTGAWRLSLLHAVSVPRVFWITHGQARAVIGPRRRGVGVHNFLFVPRGQLFALEPGSTLNGYMLEMPGGNDTPWSSAPMPTLIRTRDVSEQSEIASLIESLRREETRERPGHDKALDAYSLLIALWHDRQAATEANEEAERSTAADRLIGAFFDALERGFRVGYAMSDYAEQLSVTPTHLSRVCKAQLDRSAARLITERTLHAARTALEMTDRRAKDIAADLGFGSQAYFSRFILSHTGLTPRALRASAGKPRPTTPMPAPRAR